MEQFENLNNVMEAGTISKNEASLKSLMIRKNLKLVILVACLFMTFAGQAGTIRYVKADGTGDGSSWTNAAGNIQDMIDASAAGDQVWIAGGTYLIATTLEMKNGVNVFGGFQGSENNINARPKSDLDKNGTIDAWEFTNATILDGQNERRVLNQANPFEMETTWDGVIITKGNSFSGAGAHIKTNGKLNNCIITQNYRRTDSYIVSGGGIYNDGGTVNNCIVYGNTIVAHYAGRILYNVSVEGGGIYNKKGTVNNCMIFDNLCTGINGVGGTANARGCGIYNNEGIVSNCCIYNNGGSAAQGISGGGIYNYVPYSYLKAYVYCSTILNNEKNNIVSLYTSCGIVYNCIDAENSDLVQNFIRSTSFIGYVSRGEPNEAIDAQRAELSRADWRLKKGSQYIEAGSLADLPEWVINGTDLAGKPRVSNGKISIGTYEFDPTVNAIKFTHFDNGIKIYPNPVSESFIVDYEGFIQIKIYDMLGKEIVSQEANGKTEININHIPKGIYNVKIISESRIIGNSKIMKQ